MRYQPARPLRFCRAQYCLSTHDRRPYPASGIVEPFPVQQVRVISRGCERGHEEQVHVRVMPDGADEFRQKAVVCDYGRSVRIGLR